MTEQAPQPSVKPAGPGLRAVFNGVFSQWQRYSRALRLLVVELLRLSFWKIATSTLLAVAGVGFIGAALYTMFGYARFLETGEVFEFAGWTVAPDDQRALFAAAAVVAILVLVGSALIFVARRAMLMIALDFRRHHVNALLRVYGGKPVYSHVWLGTRRLNAYIVRLMAGDLRKCEMSIRRIFGGVIPLAILLVSVVMLFWLHLQATLVMASILTVGLVGHYFINIAAVRISRRYELLLPQAKRGQRRMVNAHQAWSATEMDAAHINALPETRLANAALDAYGNRRMAVFRAEFLAYLGVAIVAMVLVVMLGSEALSGEYQWTLLIAYLVALRFALKASLSLFQTFAKVSRLYPGIYRWQQFLSGAQGPPPAQKLTRVVVRPARRGGLCEGARSGLVLRRGQGGLITTLLPPSRYSARYFAEVLAGRGNEGRIAQLTDMISTAMSPNGETTVTSLREMLGIPASTDEAALRQMLGPDAVHIGDRLSLDPDARITAGRWRALPAQAYGALGRLGMRLNARAIVVMDGALYDEAWMDANHDWMMERLVLLWTDRIVPGNLPLPDMPQLVAAADCAVVAVGMRSWIEANADAVAALLDERNKSVLAAAAPDEEDDDDDEDGIVDVYA